MQPDIDRLLAESAWVKNLARRLLRDAHDAEEISQEVISRALTQAPTDGGPRLRAWLATVTRRLAASRAKRDGLRRKGEESAARPEAQEANLESGLALHRLLVEAVDDLPPQMREVILLRYFQELPPRVMAGRLGLSPAATSKRLSRARQMLRERLDRLSCPEDRAQGRVIWCAALTESFRASPALPAVLLMTMQTKIVLAALSTVLLFAFGWRTLRAPSPLPEPLPQPEIATLAEPLEAPMDEPETAPSTRRQAIEPAAKQSFDLRVRTSTNEAPSQARACWFEANGRPRGIALNENGEGWLDEVPESERVWVRAEGWTTSSCVHDPALELHEVILQRAERLFGTVIEDGGPPLFPFSMRARWSGPEAEPRIRGGMRKVLGIGTIQADVFVAADGSFELVGLPADSEIDLIAPSSHLYERDHEGLVRSGSAVRVESSTKAAVVLEAYRLPSVRGQVVRAEDGTELPAIAISVWLFDRQGHNHVVYGDTDSRGHFSLGMEVPGWEDFESEERAAFRGQFESLMCHLASGDSQVRGDRIERSLSADPFPIDLGTIELPSTSIPQSDRILLLDHTGSPVSRGVIGTPGMRHLADPSGVVEIPQRASEQAPLYAFAFGHAPKLFDPRQLEPDSDGLLRVQLERGYELLVELASVESEMEYLVDFSWQDSPFVSATEESVSPMQSLQQALLPAGRSLSRFWKEDSLATEHDAWTKISSDSPVRLGALIPGAEIGVLLRGADGAIHEEHSLRIPPQPGRTTLTLMPSKNREPTELEFVLRGSVRATEGDSLAGVDLFLSRKKGRGYRALSAEDGSFRIGPLRRSDFSMDPILDVLAQTEGYVFERVQWDTRADPLPELHLSLERARELDLWFEDVNGDPQAVRGVEIYVDGEYLQSTNRITPHHVHRPFMTTRPARARVLAGLEKYGFTIPAGVTEATFALPVHGKLHVPSGDLPQGVWLKMHVEPTSHPGRESGSFDPASRSGWSGNHYESIYRSMTIDLLPGSYRGKWNDGPFEEFEIVAGKTTEFQSRP